MPQKPRFSKEEIVEKAYQLVQRKGISGLTARALGDELGCSARPLFTIFNNMSEIYIEVIKKAKALYDEKIALALKSENGFKATGIAYIQFAAKYPNLFKLLFAREDELGHDVNEVLANIDDNFSSISQTILNQKNLTKSISQRIYVHLWIYTHGIATLCADGVCKFSNEEIDEMITEVYLGILKQLKEKFGND